MRFLDQILHNMGLCGHRNQKVAGEILAATGWKGKNLDVSEVNKRERKKKRETMRKTLKEPEEGSEKKNIDGMKLLYLCSRN